VHFLRENVHFAFSESPFWGALVQRMLFILGWLEISSFTRTVSVWPKIWGTGSRAVPSGTNHSLCQKARINVLSHSIKIWAELSFILSQSTCLTDIRTDRERQTDMAITCLHCCCT